MRGISKKPVAYICEADRALPKEEQTIWWLKPKTYQEVNEAMGRYGRTFTEEKDGYKNYNVARLNRADQEEWCDVVIKVENYAFPDEFYTKHPDIAKQANEEGYIKVIDDDDLKLEVLLSIPSGVYNEIFKACQDLNSIRAAEKNA